MMSRYMNQELTALARAFFHGAVLAWFYDSLTVWRIVRKSGRLASDLRDLMFWIAASLYTFRCIYEMTNGSLRGYLFAGMLMGVFAWKYSFGRYYTGIGVKMMKMLGKVLNIPGKTLKNLRKRLKFRSGKGKIKKSNSLRPQAGENKAGADRTEKKRRRERVSVKEKFHRGK